MPTRCVCLSKAALRSTCTAKYPTNAECQTTVFRRHGVVGIVGVRSWRAYIGMMGGTTMVPRRIWRHDSRGWSAAKATVRRDVLSIVFYDKTVPFGVESKASIDDTPYGVRRFTSCATATGYIQPMEH